MNLAEVGAAKHCQRAPNRAKLEQPNFWNIRKTDTQWKDAQFPKDHTSIYWKDAGETNRTGFTADGEWVRASTFSEKACLLGKSGPGADEMDINQGKIGNCWVLAAASSLAFKDDRAA